MCTIYYVPAACRESVQSRLRVLSESFASIVLKTCGPINTSRETEIWSRNQRNRAMHDHPSPLLVPSLPDLALQWFILVFRTCRHHWQSFSHWFQGFPKTRPFTRPAILRRAFSHDRAAADPIIAPYFHSMLL